MKMTFSENDIVYGHITSCNIIPSNKPAAVDWCTTDLYFRMALYKTILSNTVHDVHFKNSSPSQTANQVWESLKSEYQKDSCAFYFELKKCLYNLIHNTSQPVSSYIQNVISASNSLTSLGHSPASLDVVNLIFINLDQSFSIVCTLLISQSDELSITFVKKILTDQEDTRLVLSGGDLESAHFTKKGNRKKP